MVNTFSAFDFEQTHSNYITLPFFYGGKPASASFSADDVPVCVMSLAAAGSLRYNSGLENPPRQKFLKEVLPEGTVSVPVYLVHSKRVFVAEPDAGFPGGVGLVPPDENFTDGVSLVAPDANFPGGMGVVPPDVNGCSFVPGGVGQGECVQSCVPGSGSYADGQARVPLEGRRVPVGSEGDGVITSCRTFAPCVTAADCMPVFLWDSGTGAFGICHSGWKGTGIAAEAVSLMCARFGAKPENICVILGPHIHECCYTVDAERAAYFSREFSPDCCVPVDGVASGASCSRLDGGSGAVGATGGVPATKSSTTGKYRLSLARANIVSLTNAGVKPENILHCTDCTSCFSLPAEYGAYGCADSGTCDLKHRDKNAADIADKGGAGNPADPATARGTPSADPATTLSAPSAKEATAHGDLSDDAPYFPYGSFRRQTAHLPEGTPLEERFKIFSAMAAVIGYLSQRK